jgi:hypothetical protein
VFENSKSANGGGEKSGGLSDCWESEFSRPGQSVCT